VAKSTSSPPRIAVGYCRTSGEGQRDNTSIPNQKGAIDSWCKREGYRLLCHYVDECKSGAKIAGRDGFQQLMRDAAAGKFQMVVVYAISRWGRDGAGIIDSAQTLQREFGVDVVETAGQFDTRNRTNPIGRFISAGFAEQERIVILDRTMKGRIDRAREGKPWGGQPILGRMWDDTNKKWVITEQGREIAAMMMRYAKGESVAVLGREYEKKHAVRLKPHYFRGLFSKWMHKGKLAGPVTVHFNARDIGLSETVEVPGIPEIITPSLLAKAKARCAHNRRFNRADARQQYLLSGFIYCAECGRALCGQICEPDSKPFLYYRHDVPECPARQGSSSWMSVRGEKLTQAVLDYLYRFFLDKPAFEKAVREAMPGEEERKELERQRDEADKHLRRVKKQITAVTESLGERPRSPSLLAELDSREAELASAEEEWKALDGKLAGLPSAEEIERAASRVRMDLQRRHTNKDWRKLSPDEIKEFLHSLFGDDPHRTHTGMFVTKDAKGHLVVTFKGIPKIPYMDLILDEHGRGKRSTRVQVFEDEESLKQRLKLLDDLVEKARKPVARNFRLSME
jgi:site-specific DNA recombinase